MSKLYEFHSLESDFLRTINALSELNSLNSLEDWCEAFCKQQQFDYFSYHIKMLTTSNRMHPLVCNNYPPDWLEHYYKNDYQYIDPIILYCNQHTTPLVWQSINANDHPDPIKFKQFLADAHAFGLCSGFSIPLYGCHGEYGELSFASAASHATKADAIAVSLPYASLAAMCLIDTTRRILQSDKDQRLFQRLTRREKECLQHIAGGKTNKEIAHTLRISERTVSFHLENASKKLNATTRAQAVARAVLLHIINLQSNS